MTTSINWGLKGDNLPLPEDRIRKEQYESFIKRRRKEGLPAKIFTPELENAKDIAALIAAGGLVVIPWGKEDRRIYCLVGCYDNPRATRLMNKVKGRSLNQTLALGCLPQLTHLLAKIEKSQPLNNAACRILGKNHSDIEEEDLLKILDLCYDRSIGLLLEAKDSVPEIVTSKTSGGRTVLIAGENDYTNPQDIYNQMLRELSSRYGKVVAGTSANPSNEQVFSVFDQEQAYFELGCKVDGFVKFNQVPSKPPYKLFLTSSTIIDLTENHPIVRRWGNLHPSRFKNIFPDLVIPKDIVKSKDAETTFELVFGRFKRVIGKAHHKFSAKF